MSERSHEPLLPGLAAARARRRLLQEQLTARRLAIGLSQTEVAARMRTSQSAVARLESGQGDLRLSTLERYAEALQQEIVWRLQDPATPSDGG